MVAGIDQSFDRLRRAYEITLDTPLTFTATLPLDWTNLVAESLNALLTA